MRKWFRYAAIGTLLVAVVFAISYEASTQVGRGWLRGEAFYDGRPTSYWQCELQHWTADDADHFRSPTLEDETEVRPKRFIFQRSRTPFQKWCIRWMPAESNDNAIEEIIAESKGPSLFRGEPTAEPVLRELLTDSSEEIRRFARIGLRMEPEFPVFPK